MGQFKSLVLRRIESKLFKVQMKSFRRFRMLFALSDYIS
jgi:hypothetical protein